jgi:carbamoyltransferase
MTQTFNAKPCTVEQAPGIVHEDSTARVQTVTAAENPALYELLTQIGEARECPILLNTSFNVRGQPIVCTANDAIATFYTTPLDALYVGGQVLSKPSRDDIDEINIPGAGFSGRPRK